MSPFRDRLADSSPMRSRCAPSNGWAGPVVDVPLASFDEALKWNGRAMVGLKYEMAPSGKAVPYGVFWGSGTIWVPSHDVPLPNYAVELFHWATDFYS